ncbi:hypothetical protein K1719_010245 [Acacia pycnantha]|nr:hypothetical protein K1719_010245 [Acacia pycnantha]
MAQSLGIPKVIVEGDSTSAINMLQEAWSSWLPHSNKNMQIWNSVMHTGWLTVVLFVEMTLYVLILLPHELWLICTMRVRVVNSLADPNASMLDLGPSEVESVAVNSVFELHKLLPRSDAIEKVLSMVKQMNSEIVTVVEQEANAQDKWTGVPGPVHQITALLLDPVRLVGRIVGHSG